MDLYNRLDKNNAAVLMVDHQTGLISGFVRDFGVDEYQQNVEAMVDIANYFKLPTVLSTSMESGPNGPLMSYISENLPNAPKIERPGEINAWDNPDFVKAVEDTQKKQLIISGVVTDVCVAFVALSAINAGYEVFVVAGASGSYEDKIARDALNRMTSAGVQVMSWFSVASELHRDWRNDVEGFGQLVQSHFPAYKNVVTSFNAKN
ncbi:hypothetical protein IV73_GL000153 [Weissella kandleri]|uniref:Isochorismatase-like domain-containing protein n=1 Tax=Weissella kandleri TaxID=1616 RepID=A0A0R2JNQ9_9LACO|nr:isochorismate family cysteine hydrolase YcaC [Weissella kandleri]KRN75661.1 hypothetical protein IV73_GL000153 [Weissella kandleri]